MSHQAPDHQDQDLTPMKGGVSQACWGHEVPCGLRPLSARLTVLRPGGSLILFLRSKKLKILRPKLIGLSKLPSFFSKVRRFAAVAIESGRAPDSSRGMPRPYTRL